MDLKALHDEVLTQKDQANTCVSTAWLRLSGGHPSAMHGVVPMLTAGIQFDNA
jgi:hypothetical protein